MADESLVPPVPGPPPFLDRLGHRTRQRPHPRFGVAIAAAGAAMAVVGGVVVGGDQLGPDGFEASPDTMPGTLLSLVLVVGGYAVVALAKRDSLRAAGATASMLAMPFFLFFLTFDVNDAPPFSVDAVLLMSTVAWALAYAFGPSAGRLVYLGASLIGLWLFVLEQVESVFSAPFLLFSPFAGGFGGTGFDEPNLTTIGVVSLLFGYGYLAAAGVLDGRSFRGVATPFLVAGIVAVGNGLASLGDDLEPTGVGILLTATGVALAVYFSGSDRRATTWIGAVAVAQGLALIISDAMEDGSATAIGFTVLIVGTALVIAADALSQALSEPPEFEGPGDAAPPAPLPPAPPPAPPPPGPPPH